MWFQTFACQDSASMTGRFESCPNEFKPMNRQFIKCSSSDTGGKFFSGRGRAADLISELRRFLASQILVIGIQILSMLFAVLFDDGVVRACLCPIQTFTTSGDNQAMRFCQ